jgi:hypothetical protein
LLGCFFLAIERERVCVVFLPLLLQSSLFCFRDLEGHREIDEERERESVGQFQRERERDSLSLPLNPSFRRMVAVCVAAAVV